MLAVRNFFSTSHLYFSSRFNYRSVYFHLLFHCHYFPYLVLAFVFKFNCNFGNRYFWRCMLKHTKRQVYKWKFLQHALFRHVYNRNLAVIFTQDKNCWALNSLSNLYQYRICFDDWHDHVNNSYYHDLTLTCNATLKILYKGHRLATCFQT